MPIRYAISAARQVFTLAISASNECKEIDRGFAHVIVIHGMLIPALNQHGLLPKGIHDCTPEEIRAMFSSTDRRHQRARLFRNLEAFVAWIRPVKCFKFVYVDGSFVTSKKLQEILILSWNLPRQTRNWAERLLKMKLFDQAYVQTKFGLHVFFFVEGFPGLDLRAFFQYLRPE